MFAAAPPLMVPILNVVFPNCGSEGQSTLSNESKQEIRCSIAETPSSGYPLKMRDDRENIRMRRFPFEFKFKHQDTLN
jgi:hypothetical protein